jgi:hypothetical protein
MDPEYQGFPRLWKILNSYIGNLKYKLNQEIRVHILVWCVSAYMIINLFNKPLHYSIMTADEETKGLPIYYRRLILENI